MPSISCNFIDNVMWQAPAAHLPPLAGSIHIWRLQLSANRACTTELIKLLAPDELERANRYLKTEDRQRIIISKAFLRLTLSRYLEEAPEDIRFSTGDNNKPLIQKSPVDIQYNVSHAGDWLLIAVANEPVGIDIEKTDPSFDHTEILSNCFSKEEAAFIQSTPGNEAFYRLWTRKESLVKATAKGIDDDMIHIPCMEGIHTVAQGIIGSDKDWIVSSFDTAPQYISSVAHSPSIPKTLFLQAADLATL